VPALKGSHPAGFRYLVDVTQLDERLARVVEVRHFGGRGMPEKSASLTDLPSASRV